MTDRISPIETPETIAEFDEEGAPVAELCAAIKPYIAGKKVLDVGCINHTFGAENYRRGWIFEFVLRITAHIKGIDFEKRQVELAQKAGYNIFYGNAETYLDDEQYEVVLASDLIEHLSNAGMFLECSRRNLKLGGHLVVSTPNAFSYMALWFVLAGRTNNPKVHWQHTCYYTPTTLRTLFSRYGFELVDINYINLRYQKVSRFQSLMLKLNAAVCKFTPRFKTTMVAVFKVTNDV